MELNREPGVNPGRADRCNQGRFLLHATDLSQTNREGAEKG